jgi:hypothetical protein
MILLMFELKVYIQITIDNFILQTSMRVLETFQIYKQKKKFKFLSEKLEKFKILKFEKPVYS